jgi:AraC-like DNA-binding protein
MAWQPSHPLLRPFVEGHWIARWSAGTGSEASSLIHHPCLNLVADGEHVEVHGVQMDRAHYRVKRSGSRIVTNFLPGGFAPFVDLPVSSLNDRKVPLTSVFGPAAATAARELAELQRDESTYLARLEAFLLDREPRTSVRFEMVRLADQAMLAATPGTTVNTVADDLGVTVRTLQRAFQDFVGVAPKWVLRRYRMHHAAQRLAEGAYVDIASLAADLGYADQAHFARDFRGQTGWSPSAYRQICEASGGNSPVAPKVQSPPTATDVTTEPAFS